MSLRSGSGPMYLTMPLLILPPGLENLMKSPWRISSAFNGTNGLLRANISLEYDDWKILSLWKIKMRVHGNLINN